jgi:hypothetical protein
VEEKRESMPVELALLAPRPRERMEGGVVGGRGPTMASRGSESDVGIGERRRDLCDGLCGEEWDLRGGDRDRERSRCLRLFSARSE